MAAKQNKNFTSRITLLKVLSFLMVIRWHNILLTFVAQYLSAMFVFRELPNDIPFLLSDINLHLIVLASSFSIAAGFIINNFYDQEKDLINRPKAALFNRLVSKNTQLNLYFLFNILSLLFAIFASFNVFIFFFLFEFSLWFYSHKLVKYPFLKEFSASLLSVASFFSVGLHFGNFSYEIFCYGVCFLSFVFMRELIKDFENYPGDTAVGNQTIPVFIGIAKTKRGSLLVLLSSLLAQIYTFLKFQPLPWTWFLIVSSAGCLYVLIRIQFSSNKPDYKHMNLVMKIIIGLGVLNIAFF